MQILQVNPKVTFADVMALVITLWLIHRRIFLQKKNNGFNL